MIREKRDIGQVFSVASEGTGGFYYVSAAQTRVYRVTADGRLHFFAENGVEGCSGDHAPVISAQLANPE